MKRTLPSCIAVAGLGYVGLPLAVFFGKVIPTIGFDVKKDRIRELQDGYDRNGDLRKEELRAPHLELTDDPSRLQKATFIIVAVPTPVDRAKRPDLSPLIKASQVVGRNLRRFTSTQKPIVVYESTVYPGATEEVCVPILERESGLKAGLDFKVGYSPERINPGDQEHTLDKIVKVVAGQDKETTETMAEVYSLVVKAGVYRAPDIRTAETAKVIENVQRDLNIALLNELAILFHRLGLNTYEVLNAARTKWNFLPFEPGLVGGHCIPVDPYYLTHKAEEIGYHPEVILAGRRINDSMGLYVARETVRLLIQAGRVIRGAKVIVLGATFKENVRDARNSRVVELVQEIKNHEIDVEVFDPMVDKVELQQIGLKGVRDPFRAKKVYDAVVLAVPHKIFREKPLDAYLRLLRNRDEAGVLVDIKGVLRGAIRKTKVLYWSL
ncbi:MAG: nucleotide sugar dehydrogenase [Nitrospirota bacterium]